MFQFRLLGLAALLSGCSPFYVLRGAYEQGLILARREPIQELLQAEGFPSQDKEKLRLVLKSREFARSIGLTPSGSFTTFSRVNTDVLSWVVSASKKDSFSFHTWWFPIVGTVPYKGFFDKDDALAEAKHLEAHGYETWVRGTDAFSTLGWFNDPILSTTLRRTPIQIVNTVIHETLHATVWIPDYVDFNESLANFVGTEGAVQFFKNQVATCSQTADCNHALTESSLKAAEHNRAAEYVVSDVIASLYEKLDTLYSSYAPYETKLELRERVFERETANLREAAPNMSILQKVNNGEIAQLHVYTKGLRNFSRLFEQSQNDWKFFLEEINAIRDKTIETGVSPFTTLRERIS